MFKEGYGGRYYVCKKAGMKVIRIRSATSLEQEDTKSQYFAKILNHLKLKGR